MAQFLQLVLINLAVSCDNVSVIALATRGLPAQKAAVVRRIGIGLSMVLKIVFILIIGSLLAVSWLHIRVIGGVLLLYVTAQMLGHRHEEPRLTPEGAGRSSASGAVIAIVAADISMSLDNVVAIMGVVSADGEPLGVPEYLLVAGSLVICMPLLLWFSGAIARLMERFSVLTYLCAGYLVYTAINIIAEDEAIKLFLEAGSFTFAKPTAVLCGILMVIYGLLGNRRQQTRQARWGTLLLYVVIIGSALLTVGGLSYMKGAGAEEFRNPYQRLILEQLQSGANAVWLLGMEAEALCFCSVVLAGMRARSSQGRALPTLLRNMKDMAVFLLLYLTVVTAGLTYTFGLGELEPLHWLGNVFFLGILLLTYPAVFSAIASLTRNRPLSIVLGLLYLFVESTVTAICSMSSRLLPFAGLFPKFYLSTFVMQPLTPGLGVRILLVSALYVGTSCYIARGLDSRRMDAKAVPA